uniref:Retroviral polymerase SH3-like domain-containing protein n=1 Tax=Tanacetum cinerariifolium TaxID=118510 RepID=A0A6L2KMY3_TANCI|nr:hypothetical protein [Tanacetum cinerariifolium]
MSNTNNNLQTQTSNALHNAIIEACGKDRPPMLAPGNYVQWNLESKDTSTPNLTINSSTIVSTIHLTNSNELRRLFQLQKVVQKPLQKDNDIYSIVDAYLNACEMWKAIERSQQAATKNRGKAIVNSLPLTYDQEPEMVAKDDALSKEKEFDKLMALIFIAFKKIYKPTKNNLRTSLNTSRENQDNTLRINRGTGYDNQRVVNVVGARENVGTQVDLEANYLYMAKIQEVTPHAADNSGPIFDTEPLKKEQGDTNITIDLLDMSSNREMVDHDDHNLAIECDLFASLIEKLKCEIDDSKNRNKFLESSNKTLIDKLKGEIKDFKTKNKILESSNNHFKEANNELSKTNQLMFKYLKKFQAKLDRYHDVNYASKVEIDSANAKGDLVSYKMESQKSDGENLDKMKEKGDACIFVGYSTQAIAYKVYNNRTRMIVETIHINFDELPQMASDHVNSDLDPQFLIMTLAQDSLTPSPQSQ